MILETKRGEMSSELVYVRGFRDCIFKEGKFSLGFMEWAGFSKAKMEGLSWHQERPEVRKTHDLFGARKWNNRPRWVAHSGFSINIHKIKGRINELVDNCRRVYLVQTHSDTGAVKELMTNKHTWPQHQSACPDVDPSAYFSPSLDSAFVELPLQWRLTFIYFHPLHRILKPTFPLHLNKVLVLHLSGRAVNSCHPLNRNKDLIIISFEIVILSIWTSPPLTPAFEALEMPCIWLTSF